MNWENVTYNTKEFHRRVKDMAADLSRDLRRRKKPKPMRRNATPKQRAKHNKALAEYYAGQKQKTLFKRARGKKSPANTSQWKTFSEIDWPYDDWYDLPLEVRLWSHEGKQGRPRGSFLYESGPLWETTPIPYEDFQSGFDKTWYEGTSRIIELRFAGIILFDPGKTGERFFVYKAEWDTATQLDPDYVHNRRYM